MYSQQTTLQQQQTTLAMAAIQDSTNFPSQLKYCVYWPWRFWCMRSMKCNGTRASYCERKHYNPKTTENKLTYSPMAFTWGFKREVSVPECTAVIKCERDLGDSSYLDVAGLLHESASIFSCSVAFGELNPEKFKRALKVSLKQVLLGGLYLERER